MIELGGMLPEELEAYALSLGEKPFRARQLASWVGRGAPIDKMSNLPAALRERMAREAVTNPVSIREVRISKLDGTEKYLYLLEDGNLIEGVLMRYKHGATLCLSTQVGCKMGCAFCASTLGGCVRNLTAGEMAGQVICANERLAAEGARVHNLVLMGSGEPLDNYDNVVKFLRVITHEKLSNLSARGISLSTCGLVKQMRRFAEEGLPVTLSLSLHAPNDAIRAKLMPIARVHTVEETLAALRYYIEKTGRRVIIEYTLVEGVNDDLSCADELARRLRGMQCHVNLIALNAVKETALGAPTEAGVKRFLDRLTERNISATRRREMGDDIEGACGQLRRAALIDEQQEKQP